LLGHHRLPCAGCVALWCAGARHLARHVSLTIHAATVKDIFDERTGGHGGHPSRIGSSTPASEREGPPRRRGRACRPLPPRLARRDPRVEEQPRRVAPLEGEERPGRRRAEGEVADERGEERARRLRGPGERPARADGRERERVEVPADEPADEPPAIAASLNG